MVIGIKTYFSGIYESYSSYNFDNVKKTALQLNNLYCTKGLHKIVNVCIPVLKLFAANGSNRFENWIANLRLQRDLYSGFSIFGSISNFSDEKTFPISFELLESISGTCRILYKYEICGFDTWQEIAQRISRLSLFKYKLADHFLKVPVDFFTILSSIWEVAQIRSIDGKDFLVVAIRIGQVALVVIKAIAGRESLENWVFFGKVYCVLELGTGVLALTKLVIS